MATLTLEPAVTCMGCEGMKQYPNGFRSGLCFMCFPRSIENHDCKITFKDVLKMIFTRPATWYRCDQKIINFVRSELEKNYFKSLPEAIPSGYMLNVGKNHYEDHNLETGDITRYFHGCIMILAPGSNDPDTDVPLATFHFDRNYNIL
tara:strand:- start:275 stop:718 length:444 start_codon:yes stop_codon:yes gene_type:complete